MAYHTVLPSSVYNLLPRMTAEESQPLGDNILEDLAKIFKAHNVHSSLGVGILHRHFRLEQGEVMLHNGLRCSPVHCSHIGGGSSFFLDGNTFRAFEYDTEAPVNIKEGFLQDLAHFMVQNDLAHKIALSRLNNEHDLLEEVLDDDNRSHICTPAIPLGRTDDSQITEWRFEEKEGIVKPVVARLCKTSSTGAHKRTK